MTDRVGVFGTGPAGVNVMRALHEAGWAVTAIDSNSTHLVWADGIADRIVTMPDAPNPSVDEVNALFCDVLMAQPDRLVLWLADHRQHLDAHLFLPRAQTIARCQDKFDCGVQWRSADLREDRVELLHDDVDILQASESIGWPMWIRARHGAGARGAVKAHNLIEASHWLGFWKCRTLGELDFVAEEFLPGEDLAWTSVWCDGTLVTSFTRERVEYIYPQLAISGVTGTPTVARIVHHHDVNEMATRAVTTVDDHPHGIYCVDLKRDSAGVPRPTEINCGRFFTTSYISVNHGLNLADLAGRLALGEAPPSLPMYDALPKDMYWIRHIDCQSRWIHRDDLP